MHDLHRIAFMHALDVIVDPVGGRDCENFAVASIADAAMAHLTVIALDH